MSNEIDECPDHKDCLICGRERECHLCGDCRYYFEAPCDECLGCHLEFMWQDINDTPGVRG